MKITAVVVAALQIYYGFYVHRETLATLESSFLSLQRGTFIHFNMSTFGQNEIAISNQSVNVFSPSAPLDIDQWLTVAASSGAKYAVLTAKHLDGFSLWPTAYHVGAFAPYSVAQTTWYAANSNLDIVGTFVTKCRAHGLKPGLYFSIPDTTYEVRSGTTSTSAPVAYTAMIKSQLSELLTGYGDIYCLWFDSWIGAIETDIPYQDLHDYIKSLQPNVIIINNNHTVSAGDVSSVEGGVPSPGNTVPMEVSNTIRSDQRWFWHSADDQTSAAIKTASALATAIAVANSRSSNYILDISPSSAGVIPAAQVTVMQQLGSL